MSDENQIEDSVEVVNAEADHSIGQCLSAAREEQGISVEDVARSLKIAVRQVEALESDDYTKLPGVTFVKGFIRNYAKLLHIDPEALLARLQGAMPSGAFQPIISPNQRIEIATTGSRSWLWLILLVMAIVVAVPLLIYEKLHTEVRPVAPVVNEIAPAAPMLPPAAVEVPANEHADIPLPTPAVESLSTGAPAAEVKQAPLTVNESSTAPSPVIGNAGLVKMKFSKDAWVEIRDKDGKRIFFQLNKAGSEQVVQGDPPLLLVVGNAANVSIAYNGKPVDLTPSISMDVARLTLK